MELTEVLAKVMAKAGITEEDLAKMADTPVEPVPLADWRQGFDERFDSAHPAMWDFAKLSREGAEKEFALAEKWLRRFRTDFEGGRRLPNALITGSFGVGKTCLAGAMVRECQRAGACAGLLTLSEIIRGLWSPDAGEKREMRYEVYERRQMLVIDEFLASAQAMPQAQEAEISALLRARSAKGLSTVIVSNCPVALMAEGCSRLLYASLMELKLCVIRLTCPDRRKRLEDIGEDWDKD